MTAYRGRYVVNNRQRLLSKYRPRYRTLFHLTHGKICGRYIFGHTYRPEIQIKDILFTRSLQNIR